MVEVSVPLTEIFLSMYIFGMAASGFALMYAFKSTLKPVGTYLCLLASFLGLWAAASFLKTIFQANIRATQVLASFEMTFVIGASFSFLGLSYRFSKMDSPLDAKTYQSACGGILVAVFITALTNPVHNLVWVGSTLVSTPAGQYVSLQNALLHDLLMSFGYLSSFVSVLLLARNVGTGYRRPIVGVVLLSGLSPFLAANVLAYQLPGDFYSYPTTITAVGVPFFMIAITWSVWYDKKEISFEVRRKTLTDTGTFVIDADRRVIDYTRSFKRKFAPYADKNESIEGRKLSKISPKLNRTLESSFVQQEKDKMYPIVTEDGVNHFEFESQELNRSGYVVGWAISFKQVSEASEMVSNAQLSNRQLKQFSELVPHELRNPVSVLLGRVELAKSTLNGDMDSSELSKIESNLNIMQKQVDILRTRIDDAVVASSSIEDEAKFEWVNLSQFINDISQETRFDWSDIHMESHRVQVYADRKNMRKGFTRLFEELYTLCDEPIEVIVNVSHINENENGGEIKISFECSNITHKEAQKVFDKGYTISAREEGLGFSLIAVISEGHGWTPVWQQEVNGSSSQIRFEGVKLRRHEQDGEPALPTIVSGEEILLDE